MGIKIFNLLTSHIKDLHKNRRQFKNNLKYYLLPHTFYSGEEHFSVHDFLFILVYQCLF